MEGAGRHLRRTSRSSEPAFDPNLENLSEVLSEFGLKNRGVLRFGQQHCSCRARKRGEPDPALRSWADVRIQCWGRTVRPSDRQGREATTASSVLGEGPGRRRLGKGDPVSRSGKHVGVRFGRWFTQAQQNGGCAARGSVAPVGLGDGRRSGLEGVAIHA
jgi:hypothetical protein